MTISYDDLDAVPELDRRARAAVGELRAAVAGRTALDAPATDLPAAPPAPPNSVAGGRLRQRGLLAAAAAVIVVATTASVVALRDDPASDVASGRPGDLLLPGWLPDALTPYGATELPESTGWGGVAGDVVVYGDPEADDPWARPLSVSRLATGGDAIFEAPTNGEAVTVAGREARLSPIEPGTGVAQPGWQVTWNVDGGRLGVAGVGLSRDEVLAAAEATDAELAVGVAGLPSGYTELARGPLDAVSSGMLDGSRPSVAITYADPSESDEDWPRTMVTLVQRQGTAASVDLARAAYPDSDATTVRGQHAVIGRGEQDEILLQWLEPGGMLTTVTGTGLPEEDVRRVAQSLRPAAEDEVAALLAEHRIPGATEFDTAPEGQIVVASGEAPTGTRWRVLADPSQTAGMGALAVEETSEDGSSSGGSATSGGGGIAPPLELSSSGGEAGTLVYGLVTFDAQTVELELGDGTRSILEPVTVEGLDRRVVATWLPPQTSAGSAVARAADGREFARQPLQLAPEPLLPDQ